MPSRRVSGPLAAALVLRWQWLSARKPRPQKRLREKLFCWRTRVFLSSGTELAPARPDQRGTNRVARGENRAILVSRPWSVDMLGAAAGLSGSAGNTVGRANRGARRFSSVGGSRHARASVSMTSFRRWVEQPISPNSCQSRCEERPAATRHAGPTLSDHETKIAEFELLRERDVSLSAQRARLLGSLAGLPSRQRVGFGKAVGEVAREVVACGGGSVEFCVSEQKGRQCLEAVLHGSVSVSASAQVWPPAEAPQSTAAARAKDWDAHLSWSAAARNRAR